MSKRLFTLSLPILLAACVTDREADAPPASEADTPPASETVALSESALAGRAFAQENCASCHALDDGVSPNPNAPSLRRAARRLPAPMVAGSLRSGIQIGHTTEMPIFVFEDENIANLLAYFEVLRAAE